MRNVSLIFYEGSFAARGERSDHHQKKMKWSQFCSQVILRFVDVLADRYWGGRYAASATAGSGTVAGLSGPPQAPVFMIQDSRL